MVLLIPGEASPLDHGTRDDPKELISRIERNAEVKESNHSFLSTESTPLLKFVKHIQVLQSEYAMVNLSLEHVDDVYISSDQATTCCIVCIRCLKSRLVFLAHIDESTCRDSSAFRRVLSIMIKPELFVAGGYVDGEGTGLKVLSSFLHHLHCSFEQHVTVRLMCCGETNTDASGQPRTQRLCYETATQKCICGPSLCEVPIMTARNGISWARAFSQDSTSKGRLLNIYNDSTGELVFDLQCIYTPRYAVQHLQQVLSYSDETLLERCSTSPNAETPDFVQGIRRALLWCIEHLENDCIFFPPTTLRFQEDVGWTMGGSNNHVSSAYRYGLQEQDGDASVCAARMPSDQVCLADGSFHMWEER